MLLISEATILFFKKSHPSRKIFLIGKLIQKMFFDGLLGWFTIICRNAKICRNAL